jgi:hypothetical protein
MIYPNVQSASINDASADLRWISRILSAGMRRDHAFRAILTHATPMADGEKSFTEGVDDDNKRKGRKQRQEKN